MNAVSASPFSVNDQPLDRAGLDRIALDPQRSVVVEACAGSGKTWLLVARIMRLLLAGARPGEILSITFTRKAAQEMRERLLELLAELATADDAKASHLLQQRGLDPASAQRLLPQARGLLEMVLTADAPMVIDTFHGWFGRIVRAAPLMSGIPPGLTTSERTGELVREARKDFLARISRDTDLKAHYIDLLRLAGTSASDLLNAILQRRNEWRSHIGDASLEAVLNAMAVDSGVGDALADPRRALMRDAAFISGLREVAGIVAEGTDTEKKRAGAALWAMDELQRINRDVATEDVPQEFESLYDTVSLLVKLKNDNPQKLTKESKKAACAQLGSNGDEQIIQKIQNLAEQIVSTNNKFIECRHLALNRAALHCGAALIAAYSTVKQRNGTLDFDDLEWHAAALASNETTASYVQTRLDGRYKHLLIDEFQDTNPLQWSVLRSWLEAYGEDSARPSVFLVGDPKQSIYRFRRAEPRIFEAARQFLHAYYGADVLRTNQTRRCARAIVAALNTALLNPEYSLYAEHSTARADEGEIWRLPLIPRPEKRASSGSQTLMLRDALTTPLQDEDVTQHGQEAAQIAAALRGLIGVRTVTDESGSKRLAEYRDVLVLVRKRARITPLERALRDVGIPYVSDRRGGLLDTLEALDLSALLNFLAVPFSDLTLTHVLRTPIFSCSDDDLIVLAASQERQPGMTWWDRLQNLTLQQREEFPRLHAAHERLERWLKLAGILPVHDLLDRIYHEGRVVERYLASVPAAMRVQVRANLLRYMELALQLDSGRYPSLPRFIGELQALSRATEQESPDEGITDHGNTARILTVHGAKGLEAPIVVLVDANAESNRNNAWSVLIDWPPEDDRPSHFSVFGKKEERSPAYANLFEMDNRLAQREDWNLLYVAATRAKEVLMISGVTPHKEGANSWYQRLLAVPELALEKVERVLPGETDSFTNASITVEDFQPHPRSIGQCVAESQAGAQDNTYDSENEAQRRRGIALHAVLEQQAGTSFNAERAQRIARTLLPEIEAQNVVNISSRMLAAPQLRRFFDSSMYLRADNELELLTADGDWMRIDRLVEFSPEQGNEVWVLDYKSQQADNGDSKLYLHLPDYRAQLVRYREAVQNLYPNRLVCAALIFGNGQLIEVNPR